ncbi:MAG: outer membrane protein assembly factor BamD [Geobacteraceae bacterium]
MSSHKMLNLSLILLLAGCATSPIAPKSSETYFKEGENFYASRQYEDAIAQWKKVKDSYTSPELTAKAELKIADAHFENANYIEATAAYEDFRKLHPNHEKVPFALFRLGMCNYVQIGRIDADQTPVKNAAALFEQFLKQYPDSEYAAEVKEKLDVCYQKQVQYEIYVGRFYLRAEKYQASIKRLEEALEKFPKSPLHGETLFYLGEAYILAGDKEKGRDIFNRLFKEYPESRFVNDSRKFMGKYH